MVLLNQVGAGSQVLREAIAGAGWAVAPAEIPLSEAHARSFGEHPRLLATAFSTFAADLSTTWPEPIPAGAR
ncbi:MULTISPECIES: hypothetical protein [unclassified Kribbella]|uniref:hypothetical protein n=1 Tax=unclassified Kribbella TaxID=2644121 RepID=UPI0033D110C9